MDEVYSATLQSDTSTELTLTFSVIGRAPLVKRGKAG